MRIFGIILAIVGLVWGILAFNMSTSVEVHASDDFSIYAPRHQSQVYNLDLAEKRRTHLMISGVLVVIGSVLFGFGSIRESSSDARKCPFCAELVKMEAKICKHCGKELPDTPLPDVKQKKLESFIACDRCGNETYYTKDNCSFCGTPLNKTIAEN